VVNQSEPHRELLHEINQHIHSLNKAKMKEGIYFPRLFLIGREGWLFYFY
jgi:hypothetical protein